MMQKQQVSGFPLIKHQVTIGLKQEYMCITSNPIKLLWILQRETPQNVRRDIDSTKTIDNFAFFQIFIS